MAAGMLPKARSSLAQLTTFQLWFSAVLTCHPQCDLLSPEQAQTEETPEMHRALQADLHRPSPCRSSPESPQVQQSQLPPGRRQGHSPPRAAGRKELDPALPMLPVSSQAASGLQAHFHLPQWLAAKPDESSSVLQRSFLSHPLQKRLLPSVPLCTSCKPMVPDRLGSSAGGMTPHLALPLPSSQRRCVHGCKPWEGVIPSAVHWGGQITMLYPVLGSQGLVRHRQIRLSPGTLRRWWSEARVCEERLPELGLLSRR